MRARTIGAIIRTRTPEQIDERSLLITAIKRKEEPMAWKAIVGPVTSLYADNYGAWIQVAKAWYFSQSPYAGCMLTVAADARRAGIPVYLYYEDTTSMIYDIQSI